MARAKNRRCIPPPTVGTRCRCGQQHFPVQAQSTGIGTRIRPPDMSQLRRAVDGSQAAAQCPMPPPPTPGSVPSRPREARPCCCSRPSHSRSGRIRAPLTRRRCALWTASTCHRPCHLAGYHLVRRADEPVLAFRRGTTSRCRRAGYMPLITLPLSGDTAEGTATSRPRGLTPLTSLGDQMRPRYSPGPLPWA